ncbi:MAG: hypothetical protein OQK51_07105 [Kangiellaceae bacterium]|nr:hypothetical protein [Kangiellaceae bacterium]
MRLFIPKDDQVFDWDPENMDTYWRQCKKFDRFPKLSEAKADKLSHKEFTKMLRVNA